MYTVWLCLQIVDYLLYEFSYEPVIHGVIKYTGV